MQGILAQLLAAAVRLLPSAGWEAGAAGASVGKLTMSGSLLPNQAHCASLLCLGCAMPLQAFSALGDNLSDKQLQDILVRIAARTLLNCGVHFIVATQR